MTVEMKWAKFFENTIYVVDICLEVNSYIWIKVLNRLQHQLMFNPPLIDLSRLIFLRAMNGGQHEGNRHLEQAATRAIMAVIIFPYTLS